VTMFDSDVAQAPSSATKFGTTAASLRHVSVTNRLHAATRLLDHLAAGDVPGSVLAAAVLRELACGENAGAWHVNASVFHKLALLASVTEHARDGAAIVDHQPGRLLFAALGGSAGLRDVAFDCYHRALAHAPAFAEAHYGVAMLAVDIKDSASARHLAAASRLAPHPGSRDHARLTANADWELAKVRADHQKPTRSIGWYRRALKRLDNFGVDQRRYPDLLRRTGNFDEALLQYDRLIPYSHRYSAEFVLPDLTAGPPEGARRRGPLLRILAAAWRAVRTQRRRDSRSGRHLCDHS
jgi:tetratricopeptide (TPR) repeat protein